MKKNKVIKKKPIRNKIKKSKPIRNKIKKSKPIRNKIKKSKPIRNKIKKSKPIRNKIKKSKPIRNKIKKSKPIRKKLNKKREKFFQKSVKNIKKSSRDYSKETLLKIVRIQDSLKSKFKFNLNFFKNIENVILGFFEKIDEKIQDYKTIKEEEIRRKKIEEIEIKEKERLKKIKSNKIEEETRTKLKEQHLKEEIKIEKERVRDIKLFLRQEQALVRKEQAEKQRQFLKQLQLEKQIERFRIREVKELEKLERISLKEQREDYGALQARIEKLKEKYRIIRDQKIRERVEALGVKIQGDEDRETLLEKEKEYTIARQKIELSLESFYRSAASLVFQLNKRHVTKHMSIFRCIDRRFETGEIFIKWDESQDDEWLLLIYIKNNSPDEGIVIEDKSNPEKNLSHEFKSSEIFKASDLMVDSLTELVARTRAKKN